MTLAPMYALTGDGEPCPTCIVAALHGVIRREAIQPVPAGVQAPISRMHNMKCCRDCAVADTLLAIAELPTWDMARTVVGNDRQEQLRLPGAPLGLVAMKLMLPNQEGDLERHHAW